jgi:hypothetical protein
MIRSLAVALGLACVLTAPSASAEKPAGKAPAKTAKPAEPPKPAAKPTRGAGKATTKGASKPATKGAGKPAAADGGEKSTKSESAAAGAPSTASAAHQVVERESRIEFDERMVKGQSAAGAIYLFQRSPTEFKSIVQVPDSFRTRTVAVVAKPDKGAR